MSRSSEPIAGRFRAIRDAVGATQLEFLPRLNAAATALGVREYTQSTLSKLETNVQDASFDDVAVFASVDPKRRGKLWLAWGEDTDAAMSPKQGPSVIKQPPSDTFDQPAGRAAKKSAGKRA